MIWAVIMAGGSGTRFWPLSRAALPKQQLAIVSKKTMIEETVNRLSGFVPPSRILIITGKRYQSSIRKVLKQIHKENIIAEPCPRNTAPCLALAALAIEKRDPKGIFVALPADHGIRDKQGFQQHLRLAAELAEKDKHVVFGIPPTSPHTGYGYIECKANPKSQKGISVYQGLRFTEKPPLAQAKAFVRQGRFFWNSGIFVWKVAFFLEEFERNLPSTKKNLGALRAAIGTRKENAVLERVFPRIPSISVDYGIMEHARQLVVIKAKFDWSDVGSWQELEYWHPQDAKGNTLLGNALAVDSEGNIVRADKRLVALVGVKDLVVVDTKDALLVVPKERAQDVKNIVEQLKKKKKLSQYL